MVGAFTDAQASTLSLTTLNLKPDDARRIMRELRLLYVRSIDDFFTPLTTPAADD